MRTLRLRATFWASILAVALAPSVRGQDQTPAVAPAAPGVVRFATFNVSMNRAKSGELLRDLSPSPSGQEPADPQIRNVAEVIQRVRPDVLLLNEFDYVPNSAAVALFQKHFLNVGQNGALPIKYDYVYCPEVNTGTPSGADLDNNGVAVREPGGRAYGNDAFGFGEFPGQYGMVLLSRFPILSDKAREFRTLLWKDMPGAVLPKNADGSPWYNPEALKVFRLSSKTHFDVPIQIEKRIVHVLGSHPTPPAFDGPERRNVLRNHDELRLWADYLHGGAQAAYLAPWCDGPGRPVVPPADFVIMGDLNADPADGAGGPDAIGQLLRHPLVNAEVIPSSPGGEAAALTQKNANLRHKSNPAFDTADFNDRGASAPGNLRTDYVLPSRTLSPVAAGIFWPAPDHPLARLVAMAPRPATSDHRLTFLDIRLP